MSIYNKSLNRISHVTLRAANWKSAKSVNPSSIRYWRRSDPAFEELYPAMLLFLYSNFVRIYSKWFLDIWRRRQRT
jgi:hypothetical protein